MVAERVQEASTTSPGKFANPNSREGSHDDTDFTNTSGQCNVSGVFSQEVDEGYKRFVFSADSGRRNLFSAAADFRCRNQDYGSRTGPSVPGSQTQRREE